MAAGGGRQAIARVSRDAVAAPAAPNPRPALCYKAGVGKKGGVGGGWRITEKDSQGCAAPGGGPPKVGW